MPSRDGEVVLLVRGNSYVFQLDVEDRRFEVAVPPSMSERAALRLLRQMLAESILRAAIG